jgi:hypothetical protein
MVAGDHAEIVAISGRRGIREERCPVREPDSEVD